MILGLDIETCSATSIDNGSDAYASHESTRVWCAVWSLSHARGDNRVCRWHPGDELPSWVKAHIAARVPVLAHNWGFERAICKRILTPRYGWPEIPVGQWRDTMQIAALFNLPLGLGPLGGVIGARVQKDEEGKALMLAKAKAKDTPEGFVYPSMSLAELERLTDYCEDDVLCMNDCWWAMPKAPVTERLAMAVDRQINDRGMYLDVEFAHRIRQVAGMRDVQLLDRAWDASNDLMSLAPPVLKRWVTSRGIELPKVKKRKNGETIWAETLDKGALKKLLGGELPADVREVLESRAESSRVTSLAKLDRIPRMRSADNRLRNALRFCGAHTGRFSSKGLQVHNLPKSHLEDAQEPLRRAVSALDLEQARRIEPDLLSGLSQLLRSVISAAPGHDLIGADYSAIEARVLPWLAGEHSVVDHFAAYDRGEAPDIYTRDASEQGSDDRQFGKVLRLSLGFGAGARRLMQAGADAPRPILLPPKEWKKTHKRWRDGNPNIVQFWGDLEDACHAAVQNLNQDFEVGEHLTIRCTNKVLRIFLPSGRALHYWRPKIRDAVRRIEMIDDDGALVEKDIETRELVFWRPKGQGMQIDTTYGGKLAENVTQATARDLLCEALLRLVDTVYKIVAHVHDSAVAEVPAGTGDVDEFCALMAELPEWAVGLPVAVDGYRSPYFKG